MTEWWALQVRAGMLWSFQLVGWLCLSLCFCALWWGMLGNVGGCVEYVLLIDPVTLKTRASRLVAGFHDRVVGIAGESRGTMVGSVLLMAVFLRMCIVPGKEWLPRQSGGHCG
jgi:hypothetical protein